MSEKYGSAPIGLRKSSLIKCPECKEEIRVIWPKSDEEYDRIVSLSGKEPSPLQRQAIMDSAIETMREITEARIWHAIRSHVCSKS